MYRVRAGCEADFDDLVKLIRTAWPQHGVQHYRNDPWFCWSQFRVCEVGKRIVAMLKVYRREIRWARSTVIMGGIGDELAGREEDFVTIDANTFEVDGGLRIEEVNEELGLDLPAGDYETMAGFILSHLGRIPKQGEQLRYKDLKLAILEMRQMKVERILVTKETDAAPAS